MKAVLKWIAIILAILIIIVIVLPFVINVNTFRPRIESELTNVLGRQVTVGNLSLSLWSGGLAADNISIADDPSFSNAPFIKAQTLNVGVNMIPLIFSKTLEVRDITLIHPQVTLLRTPAGKWNFSSLGRKPGEESHPSATKPAAPEQKTAKPAETKPSPQPPQSSSEQGLEQNLSVEKLAIQGGQISVGGGVNARGKTRTYNNVDVVVKNFSLTSQFPFTLTAELPGGGNAKLDGTGGPINRSDASLTPVQAKINVKGLDLAQSGFVDPASGLGGMVNFAGTVESDGKQARSMGDATTDRLKLSPKGIPAQRTISMRYTTTYQLLTQTGELQGDVSAAKATAKLSGAFDLHGESPTLKMKLNADNMPVDDVEALLPALGVELPKGSSLKGGTLTADLAITGPENDVLITGPVKLSNTKLAGFDMGAKLAAIEALSGAKTGPDTTIQNFSSDVRYSPSGIQTKNVNLVIPALGTLTGNGTVSPQNALDYRMQAALNGSVVSGLSKVAGIGGNGATIPFSVQGSASDPKFVPDVKGLLGSSLGNQLKKNLGSQIPGGQNGQGVVNAIGGLFGKKKQ